MDVTTTDLKGLFSSSGGILGALAAFGFSAWYFIGKMYRANTVDGANASANIDMLAKYGEMLDKAYARAELAEKVRDEAQLQMNLMVREVGSLNTKIQVLEQKINYMESHRNG